MIVLCRIIHRKYSLIIVEVSKIFTNCTYMDRFKNGVFALKVAFTGDYPFKPPTIKFTTKIYNPNIDDDGSICMPALKSECWKPATNILDILNSILELMVNPNPADPLRASIAEVYTTDKAEYEKQAIEWTRKYAPASK